MIKRKAIFISFFFFIIVSIFSFSEDKINFKGIIKAPPIVSYKDIKICLLNFNFQEIVKEMKLKDDGSFLIRGLEKQPYIFIIKIEKYSREIWKGINLDQQNNSYIFDLKEELLSRIQKNTEDLRWMLRSISRHPLKEDVAIITNNKDFQIKKFFPFETTFSYLINNPLNDKITISQFNMAFKGSIKDDLNWYVTSFINSENINLVNTKSGFSHKNIEGHNLKVELTYLEHKVYKFNSPFKVEDQELYNKNFVNNNAILKDWAGYIFFTDNWHTFDFLDVDYSIKIDYISYIKNSFQSSQKFIVNFFPADSLSIYGGIVNSNKTFLQFIEQGLNNSGMANNINISIDQDNFKPQKDFQTEIGLVLRPKRNLAFQVGAFNLISQDRLALYKDASNIGNLINAANISFKGISFGIQNNYGNWFEGEISYNVLQNETILMRYEENKWIYEKSQLPESLYQLKAKILFKNPKTLTSLSLSYFFQKGNAIFVKEFNERKLYHFLNMEIKQKIPSWKNFDKCNIELIVILQNLLNQKILSNEVVDYNLGNLIFLQRGLVGGLIFNF